MSDYELFDNSFIDIDSEAKANDFRLSFIQ